jgi:hypothetical protein
VPDEYQRLLADRLRTVVLRAIPGMGKRPSTIDLALSETVVLPRLIAAGDDARPEQLGRVLARTRRAVVQGEPGAGKTTLLHSLCVSFAERSGSLFRRIAAINHTFDPAKDPPQLLAGAVPVLLRLSAFRPRSESPHELTRWLKKSLTREYGQPIAAAVSAAVSAGNGLLCLDGFDEVGNEGIRLRIAQVIEAWAEQTGGTCWLTTRVHGATLLRGVRHLQCLPVRLRGHARISAAPPHRPRQGTRGRRPPRERVVGTVH